VEVLKALIREAGTKRSIPDDNGFTALHEACRNGHLECVVELVKVGPDLIANRNALSVFGSTPLHLAAYHKHLEVCKFLVTQRADFSIKNNDGKMPLDVAQGKEVRGFFLALERQKADYRCCSPGCFWKKKK
jgi:ankyrin repeat protein